MKRFQLLQAVFLLSVIFMSTAISQTTDYLPGAYEFIKNEYGLDRKAIGELKIKDQYRSDHNQVEHVYLVQVVNGLEIFGTGINLAFLPGGRVSGNSHRLTVVDGIAINSSTPVISAPQAIGIVADNLGITTRSVPVVKHHTKSGIPVYSKEDISLQDIPADLGYLYASSGEYRLTWKLQIESKQHGELYQSFVDATNGQPIANDKLTLHCSFEDGYMSNDASCIDQSNLSSEKFEAPPDMVITGGQYRVLPLTIESPGHGDFQLVTGIDDLLASPFGWHDNDGIAGNEYTTTRGNNVHAFLDRNWDYAPDGDLDGGPGLLFDFPYNPADEPSGNQDVALTNLFFWNNLMHDFPIGMDSMKLPAISSRSTIQQ